MRLDSRNYLTPMLPNEFRLKKKKDIERVLKEGRTFFSSVAILKTEANGMECSRVGFICSKKVSDKAVSRNKAKRQMRSAVKGYLKQLEAGYDLVFVCRQEIVGKGFERIKAEAGYLLKKSGICQKT